MKGPWGTIILFSPLLSMFENCYNKSLKQKTWKEINDRGNTVPGKKHRERLWGTRRGFVFWNRRKSTKDMCQDCFGGGRTVREDEEGLVWWPPNSQRRKGRTCLPTMEETGHGDWSLRRERTRDTGIPDARENKPWREITVYIVSRKDRGDAWPHMEGLVRNSEISPRGDSHIVSEDFSASHNKVNNLGALELCLKQLEVVCSLFVRIFVFSNNKIFIISWARPERWLSLSPVPKRGAASGALLTSKNPTSPPNHACPIIRGTQPLHPLNRQVLSAQVRGCQLADTFCPLWHLVQLIAIWRLRFLLLSSGLHWSLKENIPAS